MIEGGYMAVLAVTLFVLFSMVLLAANMLPVLLAVCGILFVVGLVLMVSGRDRDRD